MSGPTLRVLSLGAGVQSTALALLAAEGTLPKYDALIFADTGWEPRAVYDHLGRLTEALAVAGMAVTHVSAGNIRDDALGLGERFASMPLYVRGQDGSDGMLPRQCTADYKVAPIKRKVRELLGYPHPKPVPRGVWVEQSIGISLDEVHRAKDSDVKYVRHAFPLLDLSWTRKDCMRYLERNGWGSTPKSACVGCPFHGNAAWRRLRDEHPDEWQDAVAFDNSLREDSVYVSGDKQIDGRPYLHRSRVPLGQAPIDRVTRAEWSDRQVDLLDVIADDEADAEVGCSPFACRSDDGDAA